MVAELVFNPYPEPPLVPLFPQKALTDEVNYEIVHQISGRLRVRISRLGWNEDYCSNLQRLLLKTNAITQHRINKAACCLVVYYSPETVTETAILEYLHTAIQKASKATDTDIEWQNEQELTGLDWGWSILALGVAVVATPLELPFGVVSGVVLMASIPLWQRVGKAITQQGELTIDSLDTVWLTAQLIQGNAIAASLALNLGSVAEGLRRNRLEQLEHELYVLFEQEDEEIHWLSDKRRFAPIKEADQQQWVNSIETTDLMQQVNPIAKEAILPTFLLSGSIGMLTGDLERASAVLPLDMGVSLRGATPLAIAAALTAAARQGVYIRNGKTLEKLAQVNTVVFTLESFQSLTTEHLNESSLRGLIQQWQNQALDIYIVTENNALPVQTWVSTLGINPVNVHTVTYGEEIDTILTQLRSQGKQVAWVEDTTNSKVREADVIISLARGDFEYEADVILHSHSLISLSYTIELARHTLTTAYESLALAIVPNLMSVGVGVIFGLDPIIAVIINGGAAILAELNSLRSPKF